MSPLDHDIFLNKLFKRSPTEFCYDTDTICRDSAYGNTLCCGHNNWKSTKLKETTNIFLKSDVNINVKDGTPCSSFSIKEGRITHTEGITKYCCYHRTTNICAIEAYEKRISIAKFLIGKQTYAEYIKKVQLNQSITICHDLNNKKKYDHPMCCHCYIFNYDARYIKLKPLPFAEKTAFGNECIFNTIHMKGVNSFNITINCCLHANPVELEELRQKKGGTRYISPIT
jgi:hypothetical protein